MESQWDGKISYFDYVTSYYTMKNLKGNRSYMHFYNDISDIDKTRIQDYNYLNPYNMIQYKEILNWLFLVL